MSIKRKATYLTRCTDLSTGDVADLLEMTDKGHYIQYNTFARNTEWKELARELGYVIGREKGLKLYEDYHVSFYKSTWRGEECYYMKWSAIEFIFTRPKAQGAANQACYHGRATA